MRFEKRPAALRQRAYGFALAVLAVLCAAGDCRPGGPPPGFIDASEAGPGFDPQDATAALQAAIDTGEDVWVPDLGSDWVVGPIFLTQDDQEIRFQEGVVVSARPGAFLGVDDSLFTAQSRRNLVLRGYGATLRMRKAGAVGLVAGEALGPLCSFETGTVSGAVVGCSSPALASYVASQAEDGTASFVLVGGSLDSPSQFFESKESAASEGAAPALWLSDRP